MNKPIKLKYNISILLFLAGFFPLQAQIKIKGKVTDSINNPLEYANVFAVPKEKEVNIAYAITDQNGNYILKLKKNKTYQVTTSYLGYINKEVTFNFTKDTIYNFVLKENSNQLDEVELTYVIPITVKQDTITYNADSFVTGEERKLKDVLKKLPGIEVDRQGNVTANGKRIKKLLVENKPFFGGNTKLGVNNIPADAIDKIQVLENYNDVAMLKGLQDSDDAVLNIKLKKDKKNFIFGDVETGLGHKERYLIHPKIFYYSPKTSVSFIGDINNQGKKSFTFKDYLDFEGGFAKLLDDAGSYFSLYNSDFANYLSNQDFKEEKQVFGAFNIRHSVSKSTDLSTYVISSQSKTETESQTTNEYLIDLPFSENRLSTNKIDNFFTIGKITLDYEPNIKTDYAFTSFVKLTNAKSDGTINTNSLVNNNSIQTKSDIDAITLKQNFNLNKNISKKHTITLDGNYHFQQDRPDLQWLTNQEILADLIPLEQADIFNIIQTKKFNAHTVNFNLKDYWSLHRFHHLYTSIGVNVASTNFFSEDVQQLDNGTINNFNIADFGNDFDYNFLDTYIGLEYKFKTGKVIFKPALFYHNYQWQTKQFSEKQNFNKNLFLPQFTTKVNFRNSEKLNIKYKLNASFPNTKILANNFILSNFNSVYKGNTNLENSLYHTLNVSYYKYNLYRGYHFNINTNLNKKIKSLKNTTQLEGIESVNTQILFNRSEQNWSTNFSFSKKIKKIRYKIKSSFRYNDFFQILNNQTNKNISKTVSLEPSITTFFKKLPNIELGYKKDFNNYRSLSNITKFENDKFYTFLEYDFLEDFILKIDYTFDKYQNKSSNINTTFDNANASLFYQKGDSPWGFEITANNIFDTTFKQQSSFSSFLISDSKTFILPRIVMFKLVYKL